MTCAPLTIHHLGGHKAIEVSSPLKRDMSPSHGKTTNEKDDPASAHHSRRTGFILSIMIIK